MRRPVVGRPRGDRLARVALVALALLVAWEWVASARAYRVTIAPEDWSAARAHIAASDVHWVEAGTRWLDPSVRAELPDAGEPAVVGRADDRGVPERWTVWTADHDATPNADDAGVLERREVGGLVLVRHRASGDRVLDSLASAAGQGRLDLQGPAGACRPRGNAFECRPGRVALEFVEVDLAARRCLAIRGLEGRALTMSTTMQRGDRLVGHVGFGDFNARLRSDAPARVEVAVDDALRMRSVVTDDQGWWGFEIPVADGGGEARVSVTVVPALAGSFDAKGRYGAREDRSVCVELRSIADADLARTAPHTDEVPAP